MKPMWRILPSWRAFRAMSMTPLVRRFAVSFSLLREWSCQRSMTSVFMRRRDSSSSWRAALALALPLLVMRKMWSR